jgi:hypothetical protein
LKGVGDPREEPVDMVSDQELVVTLTGQVSVDLGHREAHPRNNAELLDEVRRLMEHGPERPLESRVTRGAIC